MAKGHELIQQLLHWTIGSRILSLSSIIYSCPYASTNNISLHFVNNSAEFTGNVLCGGQFDKCRLYFWPRTEATQSIMLINTEMMHLKY